MYHEYKLHTTSWIQIEQDCIHHLQHAVLYVSSDALVVFNVAVSERPWELGLEAGVVYGKGMEHKNEISHCELIINLRVL